MPPIQVGYLDVFMRDAKLVEEEEEEEELEQEMSISRAGKILIALFESIS